MKKVNYTDTFLKVNKQLLSRFGPEAAIFISNLIDKYEYFKEKYPDNDGSFFLTYKQQIEQTGLTIRKLHKCKKIAISNKWIETKLKGSPAKEWYRISLELLDNQSAITKCNNSTIYESVSNNETSQLDVTKRDSLMLQNVTAYKETKTKETIIKDTITKAQISNEGEEEKKEEEEKEEGIITLIEEEITFTNEEDNNEHRTYSPIKESHHTVEEESKPLTEMEKMYRAAERARAPKVKKLEYEKAKSDI